jgi:SAM-dependent methyltransferase
MRNATDELWGSSAEAELLARRAEGFWNVDYFERIILPLLALPRGACVVDVGAGNGALTFLLARLRPDLDLTGVDLTAELVSAANDEARKRSLANVRFVEGDATRLEFPDAHFDAAVCQTLLVHLPEPARAVKEMARVLRPGGAFMAAEFHILNIDWPIASATGATPSVAESARYADLLTRGHRLSGQGELQVGARVPFLASDAGLDVIDCRINDRVAHAFPPYRSAAQQASVAEAQAWVTLLEDKGYRAWVENSMRAAGGTSDDVDAFLQMLTAETRSALKSGTIAFVWLINPVLVVTVARRPSADSSS